MKENKFLLLSKNLKKENNSNIYRNENSMPLNNNKINLYFPKLKTIEKTSINNISNYNYKINKKRKKIISIKTEVNLNSLKYETIKKIKKYKSHENIKNYNNKKEDKNEEIKDYSMIIKYLDKWDKDHCYKEKDKGNSTRLYKKLIDYYKKNNLINEEQNLRRINSISKTKPNFRQILYNELLNQNKLLKDIIMSSPTKKNINEDKKNQNNENDKRNIFKNHFSCVDIKKNNKEDIFINLLNKKEDDNKYFKNKFMKEKLKYEKELHQKLLFVNTLLFNKKFIKNEKKKELNIIYDKKNKFLIDYNNEFKKDIKQYLIKYNKYNFNLKKKIKFFSNETEQIIKKKSLSSDKNNNYISNQFKNIEYLKKNKFISLNNEITKKQRNLKNEYIEKFKELNKEKDILENNIIVLNNEIIYYKHINDELLKENKLYYINILKKGDDIRKDGLLWIVKNLIEIQVNLEYQHFPKYLNNEQIDYLKNLAYINIEENELKILISVLKKKQSNQRLKDNIKIMNLVDSLMKDKKENLNNNNEIEDISKMITQKFFKIYKNNENALKLIIDKNEEDIKIKNILNQIKKGLYSLEDNQKKNNFLNENKKSILNAFIGKTKDKDILDLILRIRNRLIDLETIKKNIINNEKENYLDMIKVIGKNSYNKNSAIKEIIRKSLFGLKPFEI